VIEGQRVVVFAFPQSLATDGPALETQFGQQILLKRVNYPSTSSTGAALPVELQWQTKSPLQENYHVFIHLLNEAGQVIAQADGQPAYWTRPTSTWHVDEAVIDRHGLWLPPTTPPGSYQLLIGLYLPENRQRLLLTDGTDAIKLPVTIE
jgi:mannosyltransferase